MCAALLCVLSPFSIPIGPVPVTLGLFVVLLTAVLLKPLDSLLAVAVYLALGCCGLPVFSGGNGGFGVLTGPTGGYLWGYLLTALVTSLVAALACKSRLPRWGRLLVILGGCLVGVALCYLTGTIQFCAVAEVGTVTALGKCVLPFIPFDLVKSAAATLLAERLRKTVNQ